MPTHAYPDLTKFINASQIAGIDAYSIDDGPARGVRALCVNTGGGLRYRVLVDRGLDIDQAFFNNLSLTFLSHKGVTPPTRALDRGLDWLKGFPVGLLTTGGPFNIGGPCNDAGEELGLHGPHSNSGATIESVIQPSPHTGNNELKIVGRIRYGAFYGPCVELKRTIVSTLGENAISVTDELYNAGNTDVPHAWLLHINFGYPLVDEGGEFCYAEQKVEPLPGDPAAARRFSASGKYKQIPAPMPEHSGPTSFVGYIYPKPEKGGAATVAIVNPKLQIGVAVRYNTAQFPRVANWQHWGKHEYVCALEPANGTVESRERDCARGLLDTLKAGQTKKYEYTISVASGKEQIEKLRAMNG